MTTIEAFAPAKINLTLHVTGQRDDGYHLLDSLVVFADVGDRLRMTAADDLTLTVTGPRVGELPDSDDNLVLRAARIMGARGGAAITLEKRLPVASGIGGGSSDAAAALRGLSQLWGLGLPGDLSALGADVTVCLHGRPCRMTGIGDRLTDVALPPLWAVLVNPGVALSTPAVFAALDRRDNPGMPDPLPEWPDAAALTGWLAEQRNDLEAPACALAPEIRAVLAALSATDGCALARMSGSGATCFGLYPAQQVAIVAGRAIARANPGYWVAPVRLGRADTALSLA
jgi:4-diphosphocytidyl-2-C-methyl-D-erythritol kinase